LCDVERRNARFRAIAAARVSSGRTAVQLMPATNQQHFYEQETSAMCRKNLMLARRRTPRSDQRAERRAAGRFPHNAGGAGRRNQAYQRQGSRRSRRERLSRDGDVRRAEPLLRADRPP
jgi:hypothetical protein